MYVKSATEVRNNWSATCEGVVREKPSFIKRTRDLLVISSAETMEQLLDGYKYSADKYVEDDGSITIALNDIDLMENAPSEEEAREALGRAILEYAEEYYREYSIYSKAPNRKAHIPYIFKALLIGDASIIGKEIVCQAGET